ncbi:molybdopterin-dependent oxidoreductase [Variovorax sp. YR566]|uniref:molybdopterin-dependent oxidoreductase n=1 Tax=Variovorax sp. YR566 TaxID=3450237 RepID=UPI003F807FCC
MSEARQHAAAGAVEIPGYCTLCRSRCGTINQVENDQLIAVRPDVSHPTGSAMCMKGKAAPEIVHSPHRLMYPMKRTRPKTDPDPGWARIGWEEALSITAERLGTIRAESGAEAVAFSVTTPSGTPLSDSIDWIERFVRLFGSPNTVYATEVCNWHKDHAHAFTFGCGIQPADYANAETIVLWGHNPANTWLAQANAVGQGRAKGAKLVVVDPRPTALARQADVWLQVRPGTDGALALGIVNLLIESGRYDHDFVRRWTNCPFLVRADNGLLLRESAIWPDATGSRCVVWDAARNACVPYDPDVALDEAASQSLMLEGSVTVRDVSALVDIVCETAFTVLRREASRYTPDEVERITGVAPPRLQEAADCFRGGQRLAYHAWNGVGQHTNATQTERALATLYALNGSFDVVGGNRVREGPPTHEVAGMSLLSPAQRGKALGLADRPIGPPASGWVMALDVYRAILEKKPYAVRAMMAFGTNLPVSHGDTALAEQALQSLEFHVHLDLFETPAARYADVLLPINSPWEREGLRVGFEISDAAAAHVQFRPQMVSARGESRSDNDIVFELAVRLGMGGAFFGGDLHAGWNHMLAPTGLDVAQLRCAPGGLKLPIDARERKYAIALAGRADAVRGFDTPTGRVEVYSETLHRHGQPAVASYQPGAEGLRQDRQRGSRFPLLLSSAKNGYYCHSQHRSLVSLRKRAPEPVAEISPGLAALRGVRQGDWIQVSTRVGQARFQARITPGLADDLVVAEFGWWQACPEFGRDALPLGGGASSNYNSLISAQDSDPVSGSVAMRSFRCDIAPDTQALASWRSWSGFRAFRVAARVAEADGVIGVELAAMDTDPVPDFHPGQHVQIQLEVGGQLLSRAYSLTGAAVLTGRRGYSIAVRRQQGRSSEGGLWEGLVSGHLHREVAVGQVVALKAPAGTFLVPRRSPQPLILLAGGIGITPFISLLESLPDGDPLELNLYYANLNHLTHAFMQRIMAHQRRLPGLRVFNHYSRPVDGWHPLRDEVRTGRISAEAVPQALIERRARIYMCGPVGLMESFAQGLVARGVPRFDIFREVFRSPPGPLREEGRTYQVIFGRSGTIRADWSAAKGTLLQLGESVGARLPSGCRVGQCESCAVKIVSGKVHHLHGAEPDELDVCLTCQAVPTTDLVLDI